MHKEGEGNALKMNDRYGEGGAALVTALVVLTLLAILGIAAIDTSELELRVSSLERTNVEVFYAADAGIEHLRQKFKLLFIQGNAAKLAAGDDPDWDFALNGSQAGVAEATEATYDGGARWLTDEKLGDNCSYNVTIWNNKDGGSAKDDKDLVIFMRADAQCVNGAAKSIEISLFGGTNGGSSIGYSAQEGGGSGKNYNSSDADGITDFSEQVN